MNKIASCMTGVFLMSMLFACGDGSKEMIRQAEFTSMYSCLAGLRNDSGLKLEVIRDTRELVSGTLSNGKAFGCEKKESGTKGNYYVGWYYVADH